MKKYIVLCLTIFITLIIWQPVYAAPQLVSPVGQINDNQPVFSWYETMPTYNQNGTNYYYAGSSAEVSADPTLTSGGFFPSQNVIAQSPRITYISCQWKIDRTLPPGTYYWHAFSMHTYYVGFPPLIDFVWNVSPTVSFTITNPSTPGGNPTILSTKLSINVKPKFIKRGKAVLLKGRLKDSSGKFLGGKKIVIKANGKKIKTVSTNTSGIFQLKVKPKKTTKYQAAYGGEASYRACRSVVVKVVVKKK